MTLYQPGQRIVLVHTSDPYTELRAGDTGTVRRHDEQQQTVFIAWDSGSTLSMCLDAGDRIEPLPAATAVGQPVADTAPWASTQQRLRTAGTEAGRQAADGWAQDIIGGRATGDVRPVARRILAGINDGEPAVLDTLPNLDLTGQREDNPSEADLYTSAAGDAVAWQTLSHRQRDEAIDAYRDAFDTAALTRVGELCELAASPTGHDVSHLHPDKVRIGSIGVFSGDWAWDTDADGAERISVGFVGTLVDRWNGWAVFTCTRPVAEAIVADRRKQRDEHRQSLHERGVPDGDLDEQVNAMFADLRFDGDVIVADQRVMSGDPQAIERTEPDVDGRYVVMGWNWCWEAVDPYACDRIVGDLPDPGGQQQFELLRHTPGMRVPHHRLRLDTVRHWPVSGGLAYIAALMLDDQRIGTVGNDGAGGSTDLVLADPPISGEQVNRYLAGCQYHGQPVTAQRLIDALADEHYLAQAVAQAKADGGTQLRLIDEAGYTVSLRPVIPAPRDWDALRDLGGSLAGDTRAGRQWLIWTGTGWSTVPGSTTTP